MALHGPLTLATSIVALAASFGTSHFWGYKEWNERVDGIFNLGQVPVYPGLAIERFAELLRGLSGDSSRRRVDSRRRRSTGTSIENISEEEEDESFDSIVSVFLYKFSEFFLSELRKEGPLCEIDFDLSQLESVCKQALVESRNYTRIQPPSQVSDCPATNCTCKVPSPGMAQAVGICIWWGISHAAVFALGAATAPNLVAKFFTCKFKDAAVGGAVGPQPARARPALEVDRRSPPRNGQRVLGDVPKLRRLAGDPACAAGAPDAAPTAL